MSFIISWAKILFDISFEKSPLCLSIPIKCFRNCIPWRLELALVIAVDAYRFRFAANLPRNLVESPRNWLKSIPEHMPEFL